MNNGVLNYGHHYAITKKKLINLTLKSVNERLRDATRGSHFDQLSYL